MICVCIAIEVTNSEEADPVAGKDLGGNTKEVGRFELEKGKNYRIISFQPLGFKI